MVIRRAQSSNLLRREFGTEKSMRFYNCRLAVSVLFCTKEKNAIAMCRLSE